MPANAGINFNRLCVWRQNAQDLISKRVTWLLHEHYHLIVQLQIEGVLSSFGYLSRLQRVDLTRSGAKASPLSAAGREAITIRTVQLAKQKRKSDPNGPYSNTPLMAATPVTKQAEAEAQQWAACVRYAAAGTAARGMFQQDVMEGYQDFLIAHGYDWRAHKSAGEAALQLVAKRAWLAQPHLRRHSDEVWESLQLKRFSFNITCRRLTLRMPDGKVKVYATMVATACEGDLALIRVPLELEKDLSYYKHLKHPQTGRRLYNIEGGVYDAQQLAMMDTNSSNLFICSFLPAGMHRLISRLGTETGGLLNGHLNGNRNHSVRVALQAMSCETGRLSAMLAATALHIDPSSEALSVMSLVMMRKEQPVLIRGGSCLEGSKPVDNLLHPGPDHYGVFAMINTLDCTEEQLQADDVFCVVSDKERVHCLQHCKVQEAPCDFFEHTKTDHVDQLIKHIEEMVQESTRWKLVKQREPASQLSRLTTAAAGEAGYNVAYNKVQRLLEYLMPASSTADQQLAIQQLLAGMSAEVRQGWEHCQQLPAWCGRETPAITTWNTHTCRVYNWAERQPGFKEVLAKHNWALQLERNKLRAVHVNTVQQLEVNREKVIRQTIFKAMPDEQNERRLAYQAAQAAAAQSMQGSQPPPQALSSVLPANSEAPLSDAVVGLNGSGSAAAAPCDSAAGNYQQQASSSQAAAAAERPATGSSGGSDVASCSAAAAAGTASPPPPPQPVPADVTDHAAVVAQAGGVEPNAHKHGRSSPGLDHNPAKCARTDPLAPHPVGNSQVEQPAVQNHYHQQQQQQLVPGAVDPLWLQAEHMRRATGAAHIPLVWWYDAVYVLWDAPAPHGFEQDITRVLSYAASLQQPLVVMQQHGLFSRVSVKTDKLQPGRGQWHWESQLTFSESVIGELHGGGGVLEMEDLASSMDGGSRSLPANVSNFESSYDRTRSIRVCSSFCRRKDTTVGQYQKAGGSGIGDFQYSKLDQSNTKAAYNYKAAVHEVEVACCVLWRLQDLVLHPGRRHPAAPAMQQAYVALDQLVKLLPAPTATGRQAQAATSTQAADAALPGAFGQLHGDLA